MDLDNWVLEHFMPMDVKNADHLALFDSLDKISDEEYQLIPREKRDWFREFGVLWESALKQQADLKADLAQREEARKRRAVLVNQGMSVENACIATPKGSFSVLDEDNKLFLTHVDNNKWAAKKIQTALLRRLSDDAHKEEFMSAALVIDCAKLAIVLRKRRESNKEHSVFHQSRSFSSNDAASTSAEDLFIDEGILLDLPIFQSKSALEMFFGVQEWDTEVICLSLCASKNVVWGTWDALHQSVENFVGLAKYAFGPHMEALLNPIMKVMTNKDVKFIVADNMIFLIYFVNRVFQILWGNLRLPYYKDGVLVPLGSLGWVGRINSLCSGLQFDAIKVMMFNVSILPTLPAIILPKVAASSGGITDRSSSMISSHSYKEKSVVLSVNASNDRKRKDVGGDHYDEHTREKGYCMRFIAHSLKIPNAPKCKKTAESCNFSHCDLSKIELSKLKSDLERVNLIDQDMKTLMLSELSKKFPKKM